MTRTGAEAAGTAQLVALAGTSGARFTFAANLAATMASAPALGNGAGMTASQRISSFRIWTATARIDLVVTDVVARTDRLGRRWHRRGAPAPDGKRIDDIPAALALATGDLNADGLIDFVSANGGDGGAVFQGDGHGFSEKINALDVQPTGSAVGSPSEISTATGAPDIVYGFLSGPPIWLRNDGVGHFREQSPTLPGMFDTRALVAMDVDGDGVLDVIAATHDKGLRVFSNTGGVFSDVSSTAVPAGIDMQLVGLVRADVDGGLVSTI